MFYVLDGNTGYVLEQYKILNYTEVA